MTFAAIPGHVNDPGVAIDKSKVKKKKKYWSNHITTTTCMCVIVSSVSIELWGMCYDKANK